MRLRHLVVVGVMLAAAGVGLGAGEAPPVPSADQIKALVDKGEYRDALKGLLRILDLKGKAAEGYDRFEMLMLRAECQMQIRETSSALVTLEAAQKEGAVQKKGEEVGQAMALTILMKASPNMKYQPKKSDGPLAKKPIDILDRKARPEAYKALFIDELSAVRQKSKAAESSRTMPPILEAAKAIGGLRGVEKIANGDNKETDELAKSLATRGAILLSQSVTDLTGKTDALYKSANTLVTRNVQRFDQNSGQMYWDRETVRNGLSDRDAADLKGFQQTLGQIATAANDLLLTLGVGEETFKELATNAETVGTRAGDILKTDYSIPAK